MQAGRSERWVMVQRRASGQPRLNRRQAALAALELIDREGLDAFSMRALGRELGVDPMAVYHYVSGREALFDEVVEVVWSEVELPPGGRDWTAQLRELAGSVRVVLERHANALPIIATRSGGLAGLRVLDHGVGVLQRAGVPPREALVALNAASSLLIGQALAEVGAPPDGVDDTSTAEVERLFQRPEALEAFPDLAAALAAGGGAPSWDELFDAGLDTLIRGVQIGLDRVTNTGG